MPGSVEVGFLSQPYIRPKSIRETSARLSLFAGELIRLVLLRSYLGK